MKNWSIGTRIELGFAAIIGIALVLGGAGYYSAVKNAQDIHDLGSDALPTVEYLSAIKIGGEQIAAAEQTLLQWNLDPAVRALEHDNITKIRETYEGAWKAFEPLVVTPEEHKLWDEFQAAWGQWRTDNNEAFRIIKKLEDLGVGDPTELRQHLEQFRGDHYALETLVSELIRDKQEFEGHEDPALCNFGKWKATVALQNPELRDALAKCAASHDKFHASVKKIKELVKAGNMDSAADVFKNEMQPAAAATLEQFQKMLALATEAQDLEAQVHHQVSEVCNVGQLKAAELLDQLIRMNLEDANTSSVRAQRNASFMKTLSLVVTTVGAVGGILLAFFIVRSITRPIQVLALALGDGSNQVASAAAQVSAASQTLAEGSSEQASSLEETGASLEEMASMTKRNAENTRQANDLAKQARDAAEKGVGGMQIMSSAMEAIKVSSDDIAKIIKTIDEIAFQTNILALNAAVEAARAGEAGMGFAVVADEVRNLAQRCAQAAKETADKIEGAITKTGQGVDISSKVSQALNDIVTKVRQVDELVTEVANASREQTEGITQINVAVGQMDQVTQSNAASAEESAAAAEELNSQAVIVKQSVAELLQLVSGKGEAGRRAVHGRRTNELHQAAPAARRLASNNGNGDGNGHVSLHRQRATAAKQRNDIPVEGDFKNF
ncbi:MAG: methyl-accepting chemotaxis protein [Verrucomicrobiota bacterium]